MKGESGAQVRNKQGASQEQAGGLLRKNVRASQEQKGGESRMNPKLGTLNSKPLARPLSVPDSGPHLGVTCPCPALFSPVPLSLGQRPVLLYFSNHMPTLQDTAL